MPPAIGLNYIGYLPALCAVAVHSVSKNPAVITTSVHSCVKYLELEMIHP